MITLETIIADKNKFEVLKSCLKSHAEFLVNVNMKVSKLVKSHPEIFRREESIRVKPIRSLIRKLNNDSIGMDELESALNWRIDDISGVRLTIATKDQFDDVEQLLVEMLGDIGDFKRYEKEDTETEDCAINKAYSNRIEQSIRKKDWIEMNQEGYSAVHYVISDKKDKGVTCEIQVRTLTGDLWAVFTHYESYKANKPVEISRKDEIRNYARLMEVADHYAKLIRDRKIASANEVHRRKSLSLVESPLTVRKLQSMIYEASRSDVNDKFDGSKVDVIELCEILENLHEYIIYSEKDVDSVIDNQKAISYLKDEVQRINETYQSAKSIPSKNVQSRAFEVISKIQDLLEGKEENLDRKIGASLAKLGSLLNDNLKPQPEMDILEAFKILCEMRRVSVILYDQGIIDHKMKSIGKAYVTSWRQERYYDELLSQND